jgi:hypothetical protein
MNDSVADFNEMLRCCHKQLKQLNSDPMRWPDLPLSVHKAFNRLDNLYQNPTDLPTESFENIKAILLDYSSSLNLSDKMARSFKASLDDFLNLVSAELRQASKRAKDKKSMSRIAADLGANGISKLVVSPNDISRLTDHVPYYNAQMLAARQRAGNYVAPISIPRFDKLFVEAIRICRRLGVEEAVKDYLGEAADPVYVSLQESLPSENWWKQPSGQRSGLEYQHLDFDFDMIKTIIYLSNVKIDNGPFKYVKDSTTLNYSRAWLAFYKCFERQLQSVYGQPMGTNGSYYYRTRFLSEEFLRDALHVPPFLLGVSHFGDDIAPDTPLNKYLSEHEVPMLSSEGNCLIFDGSRLIHRGGMVDSGSRLVVQIGFTSRRAFFKSNRARLLWLTKQRLRALRRR